MPLRFSYLWRHAPFVTLWVGESVSLFGSQVSLLALQLTALQPLHANAAQLGILGAAGSVPMVLISVFVGVWVDRLPRRRLLLIADVGQALLIGSVPVMFSLGWLRLEYLYGVALLTGCFSVLFGIAYQSFLPELVPPEQLVEGNSKLEASRAIAEIAGPSIAGTIVQVVSAPFALLVDAVSFLVSALCLKSIRLPMATPAPLLKQPSFWEQCAEGFHVIRKHALLRAIVCCSSTLNFGGAIILTVFTFYMINELHLSAAVCGIILGGGSLGSLAGAMLAAPLARWYGWGPTLLGTTLCWSMGALLLPLAHGPIMLTILLLLAGRFVMGTAQTTYNINQISLRQITLPGALHGRINATIRCLAGSAVPLGSFLGGGLGTLIGVRGTLLFGAISLSLSSCWLFFSPVRYVQKRRKATSVDPSRS